MPKSYDALKPPVFVTPREAIDAVVANPKISVVQAEDPCHE